MRALRIQNNQLNLGEVPLPESEGEALVRVIKSGVCGTDLELVKGYANFNGTPGHEFVGIVEIADQNPGLVGKRVVGEINAGCGTCELCKAGDPRHCPDRTVLGIVGRDGAHAEYLTLPAVNLLQVPDHISDESAVFVEPLAAAVGITERVDIKEDDKIAVVGDGKLGILSARALAAIGFKNVVLFGKTTSKLALASGGSFETFEFQTTQKMPFGFDVVVEASGSESGFETALQIVKPRGTIVLKSTYQGRAGWDASRVVVNEVTVAGSRCGRFAPALELLASNQIKVDDLISDEFKLSDGVKAFEKAGSRGVLKVLISMEK
jgi:threonine dehydrogenase-like Zn-dependent dehydrogenase